MGAWGLRLFQSDYDYNVIQGLNYLTRLPQLEKKAGKIPWKSYTNETRLKEHDVANKGNEPNIFFPLVKKASNALNYSVYSGLCTDPDLVRKHLDSGTPSILRENFNVIHHTTLHATKAELENADGPGYDLVILGACAMSLGARLTDAELDVLRSIYKRVGLMRDAVTQMTATLDPVTGYKPGTAWDFGSLGMRDCGAQGQTNKEDLILPGVMLNTWAPVPYDNDEMMSLHTSFRVMIAAKAVSAKDVTTGARNLGIDLKGLKGKMVIKKFGEGECAGCGEEKQPDGRSLMVCSKCGKESYCGVECQKVHWKLVHKTQCKV